MPRGPRAAWSAVPAALLVVALAACGSGDGGSEADDSAEASSGGATVEKYCSVVNDPAYFEDLDETSTDQDYVDAIQAIAADLREVGPPEDIPDDAREGFEIQLDRADELEADDVALPGEEDPFLVGLSKDEKAKVAAYRTYESDTCAEPGGGTPEAS